MRVSLIALGRLKAGPEQDLFTKYFERAQKTGKQTGFDFKTPIEYPEAKNGAADQRKQEEAEKILNALPPHSIVICLDERGKDISSQKLSQMIRDYRDNNEKELAFVIGGPDGLSQKIRDRADHMIALGKFTYPHMLARILLMEQLYRAITIETGHPYHRE